MHERKHDDRGPMAIAAVLAVISLGAVLAVLLQGPPKVPVQPSPVRSICYYHVCLP
jgi:hypothetical protein